METLTKSFEELYNRCKDYTMTCKVRVEFLYEAMHMITDIEGACVECGVWKGGNILLMSEMTSKEVWGYDTFNGMPEPSIYDKFHGREVEWREGWNYAELQEVQSLVPDAILIPGKVQDTIPEQVPDKIAILRLDTDFYDSTKHELEHLYPRLQEGGIFITDDYGSWSGARKACDEYGLDLKQIANTNAFWCYA